MNGQAPSIPEIYPGFVSKDYPLIREILQWRIRRLIDHCCINIDYLIGNTVDIRIARSRADHRFRCLGHVVEDRHGTAKLLGDKAPLKALKEGEEVRDLLSVTRRLRAARQALRRRGTRLNGCDWNDWRHNFADHIRGPET